MIPQRVSLKGFLCYKEEQQIAFDGASLWVLTGLNGSGKSSIFDAVTFALFGHHRGGSQDAHELINKDSDKASVAFDFLLDGQLYQAYRTVQRTKLGSGKGSQQIYRFVSNSNKQAIEGTNNRAGFTEWVQQHIGLNYETFTSSVLLLQGLAEKLLDSTAKGRFEVLAGIVDLDRYERLHAQADDMRRGLKNECESLENQIGGITPVNPAELLEAEAAIELAEAERQKAQREVERCQRLEYQAAEWAKLQVRLVQARQHWQDANALLADASAIERDVERLRDLREVLPKVEIVITEKQAIHQSESLSADLTRQLSEMEEQLSSNEYELRSAHESRGKMQTKLAAEEERSRRIAADRPRLQELIGRLNEVEQLEKAQERLQTSLRASSDPEGLVRQAKADCEPLIQLAQALPHLERFQKLREEARQSRTREQTAGQARDRLKEQGTKLRDEFNKLEQEIKEAKAEREQADFQSARTGTLREQADQQLKELADLDGAPLCRLCGQLLTADHLAEEKRRRKETLHEAQTDWQKAIENHRACHKKEGDLESRHRDLKQRLEEAREEFKEQQAQAQQATRDLERLDRELTELFQGLAEPFRHRVSPQRPADWLQTLFPAADELAGLRRQAAGLPAAEARLREAEQVLQQWKVGQAQLEVFQQSLTRQREVLPVDRLQLRQQHLRLENDAAQLEHNLAALRKELGETGQKVERLQREHEQLTARRTDLKGKLGTEAAKQEQNRRALDRAVKDLPAAWQAAGLAANLTERSTWMQEREELIARGTEERGRRLREASTGLALLKKNLDDLETQQAQIPEEARQHPDAIAALVQAAKHSHVHREESLLEARQRHIDLEKRRTDREALTVKINQTKGEQKHAELLAKLLGRDRLQLHLVRQAERQVIDHANAVLDRLSGGQLFLNLSGEAGGDGTNPKALELEAHNRTVAGKPINVAFLSGSQKFRVAVSLALGIGQYASRQHRPIESVIIDEGFGCLDRNGRQVMIQELQNLRSQMRCILLVSHQEEFAEAFNDGYRFELTNGSTVATRFQK